MVLKKARVLVVDDDTDVLFAVRMLLKPEVQEVVTEKNPELLLSLLSKQRFDVIFLDMNYKSTLGTGNEGLYWLGRIREKDPTATVIMITAHGEISTAVRSLKAGATDFIVKPWHNAQLLETLAAAVESKEAGRVSGAPAAPRRAASFAEFALLGESEAMQEVFHKVEKVAPTEANILLLGENGTGKELVAKALHQKSFRAARPFVTADLAAMSEGIFESELFGHKKGAFTDAREDRIGRFAAASGGTLFLDEIGNISLAQQAKLLTALQNRQIIPVGSNAPVAIDIRLISATNAPLYELAAQQQFRKDLIYRLNTVEITLPPLRARGDDVLLLARHFAGIYAARNRKPTPSFETATLQKLRQHSWPGNVRELQHTVERAVILADGDTLRPQDFHFSAMETAVSSTAGPLPAEGPLQLSEIEKSTILRVIERHNGNITKAAKELGITRTALYRRLEKHDL
ncbi:sigma-54-dependent transcriptional regulator [Hymenobacter arizonensis]|uniref:DNA-binding transcriptional response regulator, NtrC family, contains REC, AAA-type ATPase, and a Fis-type DNA-binding domains n=1 Tax=Hymenobacter arizonensis TaxID=1227077 RepID=A0A1I5ZQR2_HYMAR|nr:sigma-54 dependent transcriptional regulator [Hymenobacter arizonensis]SFQ58781.1 DNA-binding transcriptional response regulator, NtrC family, contains REC, AAA-type ATPase, and a Fis-type DNA-binding domains [Hymenobacter arizonensis]